MLQWPRRGRRFDMPAAPRDPSTRFGVVSLEGRSRSAARRFAGGEEHGAKGARTTCTACRHWYRLGRALPLFLRARTSHEH